jgi:hypothetical protein
MDDDLLHVLVVDLAYNSRKHVGVDDFDIILIERNGLSAALQNTVQALPVWTHGASCCKVHRQK